MALGRVEALAGRASLDPQGTTVVQAYLAGTPTNDKDLAWLGKLSKLQVLDCRGCHITSNGIAALCKAAPGIHIVEK